MQQAVFAGLLFHADDHATLFPYLIFTGSLQTAAKCSYTKMGVRQDGIVQLWPLRVVLLWALSRG